MFTVTQLLQYNTTALQSVTSLACCIQLVNLIHC